MLKVNIEMTDTFGGEANYSWCKRKTITVAEGISSRALIRRCKKEMEVYDRHKKSDFGDMIRLDFSPGWLAVMFITYDY